MWIIFSILKNILFGQWKLLCTTQHFLRRENKFWKTKTCKVIMRTRMPLVSYLWLFKPKEYYLHKYLMSAVVLWHSLFIFNQTSVNDNITNDRICLCQIYYNSNTVALLSPCTQQCLLSWIEEDMTPKKPHPTCGLISWWMSVLSWLSVSVLVFVDIICTSESCRAIGSWLGYLWAQSLRISVFMLARVHSFLCFKCDWIIARLLQTPYCVVLPPLIIQVEGQNKSRGYCGCVCACACICVCVCITRGWRGCVKEEVLSGTEAFCRCCREEGVNGKFCGYQSYSALWLAKVCHMWTQSQFWVWV